jgi:hypothetical protein
MRVRAVLAVVIVGGAATLVPRDARADFDFQLSMGTNARWMSATPAMAAPELTMFSRIVPAGDVPMRGGMTMLGAYVDAAVTLDDRWVLPLIGGGYYHALGSYNAVISSRDGSLVRMQPWTADSLDIYLPGLGYRMKRRRWMFGAALRTGVSFLAMDGLVADGAEWAPLETKAMTFLLQAELEACRRLDPTTRVCLQVAPRVYDHQLMNGVMFGLRAEWGR